MSFDGRVAWVTGASAGIGAAVALELARRGADVAVSARRKERLEEVAGQIEALGRRALVVPCDVSDEGAVAAAVEAIAAAFGRLDVAVANAGFGVAGAIRALGAAEWRRQLDVNVVGVAMTARYAIPELEKTGGRLVLVGSVASMLPVPRSGAYVASKYALRGLGQTLAIELQGSGVSCSLVHPGFVESDIARVDNEGVFHPEREDRRPRRLLWPTAKAARAIVDAAEQRRRELVFTGHGRLGGWVGRHLPGLVHFAATQPWRGRR